MDAPSFPDTIGPCFTPELPLARISTMDFSPTGNIHLSASESNRALGFRRLELPQPREAAFLPACKA